MHAIVPGLQTVKHLDLLWSETSVLFVVHCPTHWRSPGVLQVKIWCNLMRTCHFSGARIEHISKISPILAIISVVMINTGYFFSNTKLD